MSDGAEVVLVVNPTAGAGRAARVLPALEAALREGGLRIATKRTSHAGHATQLVREALAGGAKGIAVVGGDGTLHEATNGFFDDKGAPLAKDAWLAPLSAGTGGDFRKSLGHDEEPLEAARRLARKEPRAIDVGWLEHVGDDGFPAARVFLNIASFGLGGVVDRLVNEGPKWMGGRAAFLFAAARGAATYKPQRVRVTVDDAPPRESKILNVAVANGQYFGGGMHVAPEAKLDDGLFDVVWMNEASFVRNALDTPKLYRGTHLSLPHVALARGTRVHAESVDGAAVLLDVDGETPGRLPATFTIKKGALLLRA